MPISYFPKIKSLIWNNGVKGKNMFMTFRYILSDSGQYLELKVFKNLLAVKKKKKLLMTTRTTIVFGNSLVGSNTFTLFSL